MPTYVRYVLRRTQYVVDHSDGNGLNSSPTRTEKTRQQAPLTFKPAEPISVGVEAQNEIVCVASTPKTQIPAEIFLPQLLLDRNSVFFQTSYHPFGHIIAEAIRVDVVRFCLRDVEFAASKRYQCSDFHTTLNFLPTTNDERPTTLFKSRPQKSSSTSTAQRNQG